MSHLLLSLGQLALAILLSAFAVFLAFYVFQRLTGGLDEWAALRSGNAAVGVVLAAVMATVALVLRPALALQVSEWDLGVGLFYRGLLAQAVALVVGLALGLGSIALALGIFSWLTRGLDEVSELSNGNLSVGLLLAGTVVAVGLLVSQALAQVMNQASALLF